MEFSRRSSGRIRVEAANLQRRVRFTITVMSVLVIFNSFAAPPIDAADIYFKSEGCCRGPVVRLGEIADVHSADRGEKSRLERIELFPAPAAGRHQLITFQEVRERLQLDGMDLRGHHLDGARRIRLTRGGAETGKSKRSARRRRATPAASDLANDSVVVLKRDLRAGDIVRLRDVELRTNNGERVAKNAVTSMDRIVGMEMTRAVSNRSILRINDVRHPLLVRRGDIVTVVARAAGIRIKSDGKSLRDGSLGELVTIQSRLDRKQRFSARVVDVQQVQVLAQSVAVK